MGKTGFIKIHRKIRESSVYQLPPAQRCVFLEVLLSANWKPGTWTVEGQTVPVARGEFITSYQHLATRAGVSKGCTRRALKALESAGTLLVYPARRWTRISVVNYEQYQTDLSDGSTTMDPMSVPTMDPTMDPKSVHNRRRKKKEERKSPPSSALANPPEALALAHKLRDHILTRQPDHRDLKAGKWEATQERWADSFRLANSQDDRTWADMARVLDWCQRDSFWHRNILSGSKFRDKFDTLKAQMGSSTHGPRATVGDLFGGDHE